MWEAIIGCWNNILQSSLKFFIIRFGDVSNFNCVINIVLIKNIPEVNLLFVINILSIEPWTCLMHLDYYIVIFIQPVCQFLTAH